MRVVSLTASAAFLSLVFSQGTALANAPTSDHHIALTGTTTSSEHPVQKITLTSSQGEPTRVAQAGLENVGIGNGHSLKRFSRATLQSQGTSSFDPSDNAAILTEPISVDPFMVTGLSWSGESALSANTQMFIRVRENGQWSQWYLTDKDGGAGKDRADGTQARGGTDPFITAGADGIQIRVTGDEDDLPADLEVAMIPDNPQGETTLAEDDVVTTAAEGTDLNLESVQAEGNDFTSLIQPEQNTEADSQSAEPEAEIPTPASSEDSAEESTQTVYPGVGSGIAIGRSGAQLSRAFPKTAQPNGLPVAVTSRAGWGADESYLDWDPEYYNARHVVIHHTAGTNNYSMDQSASIVRGIYHYHAVTLDWGDIGYNFLVDKWGRAFEGRKGTLSAPAGKMVAGAHDQGFNSGTMGISMMGTYQNEAPSQATLNTVGALAGWQLRRAGVNNMSEKAVFKPLGSNPKYRAGTAVNLPRISGHRDTYPTSCPGDAGYAKLQTIREIAQNGSRATTTNTTERSAAYSVKGAIRGLWNENHSLMGDPKSEEELSGSGSGVYQIFERGTAYWTEKTGAHFVSGSIFRTYGDNRYERGFLGFPTSHEYSAGSGRVQEFEGGVITTSGSGNYVLRFGTGIANTYRALGGAKKFGAVTSAETRSARGVFQVFDKGTAYWTAEGGTHFVSGEIFKAYGQAGYERGSLGYPLSDEYSTDSGRIQEFQGGVITSSTSGSYTLRYGTGIANAFREIGGVKVVGLPRTSETQTGKGVYQVFDNGTAYWTPQGGTHFVRAGIFNAYGSKGYERGFLGFPVSDEYSAGSGRAQEFEGGVITWSAGAGTYVLRYGTGIANAFREIGGVKVVGLPRTSETQTGKGVYQVFDNGTAYWTPQGGTHFVRAGIFNAYGSKGYERGFLGFPVSDEYSAGSGRAQEFEGGVITWSTGAGTYVLRYGTGIANAYRELGGARFLGVATTAETPSGKGVFQVFDMGTAYWSATGGSHFVRGQIFTTYGRAGFERGGYGYPTSDEFWSAGRRVQYFEGGRIAS